MTKHKTHDPFIRSNVLQHTTDDATFIIQEPRKAGSTLAALNLRFLTNKNKLPIEELPNEIGDSTKEQ